MAVTDINTGLTVQGDNFVSLIDAKTTKKSVREAGIGIGRKAPTEANRKALRGQPTRRATGGKPSMPKGRGGTR